MPVELSSRPLQQRPVAAALEREQAIENEKTGVARKILALIERRLMWIAPSRPGQCRMPVVLECLRVHDMTVESPCKMYDRVRARSPHAFRLLPVRAG